MCLKVNAYPLFAWSVLRPGRFMPIVVVLGGGLTPDGGRLPDPPLLVADSSDCDCERINNSKGIG